MKKNFKIILALLLVLSMALSACAPAAPKQDAPKQNEQPEAGKQQEQGSTSLKGEITVQAETAWMDYYKKAAEKIMQANPEAKITVKEIGAFEHLDLLNSTDATNPDFADVFAMPADRFFDLAEKEVLASIDAQSMAAELGGFENYDAGLGGNLKYNDNYLAFPYNIETLVNFVNTANAKAEGIDHTMPIEMNDVKKPQTILLPIFDAWFGVAAVNSAKIEMLNFDKEGKLFSDLTTEFAALEADKKALVESLYKYWKLNTDAKTPLFDADAGWGYIDDTFTTGGQGVFRIGGPWETNGNVEKAGLENLEVYPINHITINGKPLAHWQGGWGLAVNSRIEDDVDKMLLATELIKELVRPENAVELYKATGKILENVGADVYEASDLSDLDKKVIKNVIVSYKVSPPRPLFKEFGRVWDTWKNAVLSWNAVNPADAEAAYKEIKASFDSMMTNF